MIKILALDIDGVLTDGKVALDCDGRETKTVSYRDIDAIFEARRKGLEVVLITGEDSDWVKMIAAKLSIKHVYRGAKDKYQGLLQACRELNVELTTVCYVGDTIRDIEAIARAGIGFAPADAHPGARAVADSVLQRNGGCGAVAEAVDILLRRRDASE